MHLLRRGVLRRTVLRLAREGHLTADQAKAALRPRALSALNSRLDAKVLTEPKPARVLGLGDGKLLEWLWANKEELLAFILEIIKLFKS